MTSKTTWGNHGSAVEGQVGSDHGRLEGHRPAAAKAFAAEGCRVHLAARDRERLDKAKAELGGDVSVHAVDLREGAALRRLAAACAEVDILVNNAGDIPGGTIEAIDEAKWRHAWELKVFGYVNLTRELFARMKARKAGVIVNVIGMAGEHPSFEYICGSMANAGLGAFTKAMGKGRPHRRARARRAPAGDPHRSHHSADEGRGEGEARRREPLGGAGRHRLVRADDRARAGRATWSRSSPRRAPASSPA